MQEYLDLLSEIYEFGVDKSDRTGVGTRSLFGRQLRFDISKRKLPLVTTKKIHLRSVIYELLWFLSGDTNIKYLQENKVRIWDEWATKEQCARFGREEGDLGPIYGHQWRNFGATRPAARCYMCGGTGLTGHRECYVCINGVLRERDRQYRNDGVDQIQRALDLLKTNPDSRRIIVSGWNPQECDTVALPPCHTLFQFYVLNGSLSCQLYQRSADVFLGVPFNIASYSILTHMVAQVCGLETGEFIHTFGDVHIYSNHLDQVELQLQRQPRDTPKLFLNPDIKNLFEFEYKDFAVIGYDPHPVIKAEVAV